MSRAVKPKMVKSKRTEVRPKPGAEVDADAVNQAMPPLFHLMHDVGSFGSLTSTTSTTVAAPVHQVIVQPSTPLNTASAPFSRDSHDFLNPTELIPSENDAVSLAVPSGHNWNCKFRLDLRAQASRSSSVSTIDMSKLKNPLYSYYFEDGVRRVDFVLVYSSKSDSDPEPNHTADNQVDAPVDVGRSGSDAGSLGSRSGRFGSMISNILVAATNKSHERSRLYRKQYEENLLQEGLQLEYAKDVRASGLRFVKVHATWDVMCRLVSRLIATVIALITHLIQLCGSDEIKNAYAPYGARMASAIT